MASWATLVERATHQPRFQLSSAEEFSVEHTRDDMDGTTRAQRVWIRRYVAWGDEMIEIRSAFASSTELSSEAALLRNLELPIGAIARHGEVFVLLVKLPLKPISAEGVLLMARRVSMVADVLEAEQGVDRF